MFGLILYSSVTAKTPSATKVLVMGDSLSAAYGLPPEQGWVAALQQRFSEAGAEFVNASVSGATTAAGLERLPRLLEQHRPHWVFLELGANDGLQGKPLGYIKGNLRALIENAQEAGAKVILVGVRLPPNLGARYTEPFFDMYAELAQEYHLHYIPFVLQGVAGDSRYMQADGLHPNAAGQEIMAEYLGSHLQSFLYSKQQ